MSAYFPNGTIFAIGTAYAATKTISAVSNANPGVATSTAHGYTDADILLLAGIAWVLAALGAYFRDLNYVIGLVMTGVLLAVAALAGPPVAAVLTEFLPHVRRAGAGITPSWRLPLQLAGWQVCSM